MLKELNCLEQKCQLQKKEINWSYKKCEIFNTFYECEMNNINITKEEVEVSTITSEHFDYKTDNDVDSFSYYKNCTIKIIPNSIFQKLRIWIFFQLIQVLALKI